MERMRLGGSELVVSRLCMGTMSFGWTADEAASFALMDAYVEAGGNFVDTADIYSRFVKGNWGGESERILGKWLKARGGRDKLVIATKVRGRMWKGPDGEGLSRAHIMKAAEQSLRRLGVETVDLYQCHWPDEDTPIEETLRAFEDLRAQGKVRFFGASNYPPESLEQALDSARTHGLPVFVSLQPHYNLVHRPEYEDALQALCVGRGLGVIAYSPLAKGFLSGRYTRETGITAGRGGITKYASAAGWDTVEALRRVATARGTTPAAVALAWLMCQSGIVASIMGARSAEQLAEQLPAATLELSRADLQELDRVSKPAA